MLSGCGAGTSLVVPQVPMAFCFSMTTERGAWKTVSMRVSCRYCIYSTVKRGPFDRLSSLAVMKWFVGVVPFIANTPPCISALGRGPITILPFEYEVQKNSSRKDRYLWKRFIRSYSRGSNRCGRDGGKFRMYWSFWSQASRLRTCRPPWDAMQRNPSCFAVAVVTLKIGLVPRPMSPVNASRACLSCTRTKLWWIIYEVVLLFCSACGEEKRVVARRRDLIPSWGSSEIRQDLPVPTHDLACE